MFDLDLAKDYPIPTSIGGSTLISISHRVKLRLCQADLSPLNLALLGSVLPISFLSADCPVGPSQWAEWG